MTEHKPKTLPRNYFKELLAMIVIAIIGIAIIALKQNELQMTIGGGIFTSSIVGAVSLTTNSLRKRRADLELLTTLSIKTLNRMIWLKQEDVNGRVNEHSLQEINTMITELDISESIYGRLWFIKKENRNKCYRLYQIMASINRVEPELIQYRMTTTTDVSNHLQIEKLKQHFTQFYNENKDAVKELYDLTDWAIEISEKAVF